MTLVDPKSGAGWAFGEQLTSTQITTISTQLPRALDAVSGGTYTLANAVNWSLGANVVLTGAGELQSHLLQGTHFRVTTDATLEYGSTIALNPSRTLTRRIPMYSAQIPSSATGWTLNGLGGSGGGTWLLSAVNGDADVIVVPLSSFLPHVCTVNYVRVYLNGGKGAGAPHANLPAQLPSVAVATYSGVWFGTNDGAASVPAVTSRATYEQNHYISATLPLAGAHDSRTDPWWLELYTEAGADNKDNCLGFYDILVSCTVAAIGEP